MPGRSIAWQSRGGRVVSAGQATRPESKPTPGAAALAALPSTRVRPIASISVLTAPRGSVLLASLGARAVACDGREPFAMPIVNRLADLQGEIAAWRHDIHAHPELLYDVHRTAATVAAQLNAFGCDEVVSGVGRTGVVGVIKGNRPGG